MQLRLQRSNARNKKSTSRSHSCGEQNRSKPSLDVRISVRAAKRVQGDLWVATCAAFCFLKTEEEASSTIVWSRDQNDGKQAEHQANVRHFELSRKRIAARMRTCQCMSHFLYDLRSRPLVRDPAARVRGQIASDHCRSDLITGRTHWARAGYPFPEVNLPEYDGVR